MSMQFDWLTLYISLFDIHCGGIGGGRLPHAAAILSSTIKGPLLCRILFTIVFY